MKKILMLTMTLLSLKSIGQVNDSTNIEVVYTKQTVDPNIVYFVNGQLVSNQDFSTIGPLDINLVKKDTIFNGHTYTTQVYFTTKSDHVPSFITLNALKKKYTNLKDGPSVYMIDDRLINSSDEEQLVDEKAVLRITIDKVNNPQKDMAVDVIKVYTKFGENAQNAKP
ncbi:hypothetical protein SAMN05216436_11812 [bacterium A37T11]|nr:hypothetical protein SAMN05216436_11812 [bacterium A37T11]